MSVKVWGLSLYIWGRVAAVSSNWSYMSSLTRFKKTIEQTTETMLVHVAPNQ